MGMGTGSALVNAGMSGVLHVLHPISSMCSSEVHCWEVRVRVGVILELGVGLATNAVHYSRSVM